MIEILFATKNQHKIDEVKSILKNYPIKIYSLLDLNIDEIDVKEDGVTYIENAFKKARSYQKLTSLPIISDDSGLEILSLNNMPGLKSARYAKECGSYYEAFQNIFKLLDNKDRSARFVCHLSLVNFNSKDLAFYGQCNGKIINVLPSKINKDAFGYDPIFVPDQYDTTFDKLSKNEKNNISHRHNALMEMIKYLISIKAF